MENPRVYGVTEKEALRREVELKIADLLDGFDVFEGLGALATVTASVIRYAFPAVIRLEVADHVNLSIKKNLEGLEQ